MPHHWVWRCYIRAILKILICRIRQIFAPSFELHNLSRLENTICLTLCRHGFVVAASGLLGAVRGETSVTSPWLHYPAVCDHSKALLGVRAETPSADELPPPSNGCCWCFPCSGLHLMTMCVHKLLHIPNFDLQCVFFHLKKHDQPWGRCGPSVNRLLLR